MEVTINNFESLKKEGVMLRKERDDYHEKWFKDIVDNSAERKERELTDKLCGEIKSSSLSVKEIAIKSGMPYNALRRILNGHGRGFLLDDAVSVCKAINIDLHELIKGEEDGEAKEKV